MIHCVNLQAVVYQKTVVILAAYQLLIMMRSINFLLEMTKQEKFCCCWVNCMFYQMLVIPHCIHARKDQSVPMLHTTTLLIIEKCVRRLYYLHDISEKQFKNIVKHLKDNDPVPIVHGNTGKVPKTTYLHEVIFGVVWFIKKFAEIHGLPHPSARCDRADIPPVYLPASQNKTVHDINVKSVMEWNALQRVTPYRSFIGVWHKCILEVQFMTPCTDVCAVCEKYCEKIKTFSQRKTRFHLVLSFLIISFKHKQNIIATYTGFWLVNQSFQNIQYQISLITPFILLNSFICHTIPIKWDLCILKVGRKVQFWDML